MKESWNKRSEKEVKEIVYNLGYKFLKEYADYKWNKRVIIQDEIGYRYDVRLDSIIDGHKPSFTDIGNPFSLINISLWLKLNNKEFNLCNNNIYGGYNKNLSFQCLSESCGEKFEVRWDKIYNGGGCPFCSGKRVGKYNNLAYLRPDLVKEWDSSKNKRTPEEYTEFSTKKVYWTCSKCKAGWISSITNRSQGSGCPKCKKSMGEKRIQEFFIANNLEFEKEAYFNDCKYKGKLRFDFYLPDYNLCIEYQGEQHYRLVEFFGGKKTFEERQIRDKIKKKYCEDNNIRLLMIPHWDFDNIENILNNLLFGSIYNDY